MINRKVATSEKVAELGDSAGPWAVVFQHRLIAFLDKNGNCRADPYWLKAEVMPRVAGVTPEDCRRFAGDMAAAGLAVPYEVGGMPYLHIPGFRDEQVGLRADRESADVPVPQGFDEASGRLPESFRIASGKYPAEVEGEVEVEVEETTDKSVDGEPSANESDFALLDVATDTEWRKLQVALFEPLRQHIWKGKRPPSNVPKNGRKWDEARELSLIRDWIRGGLLEPDEAADFLRLTPVEMGWRDPASLSWLGREEHIPRIREIVGRIRKDQMRKVSESGVLRVG